MNFLDGGERNFAALRDGFRWQVPARFNIGVAVCDAHAGRGERQALYLENAVGARRSVSFDELKERSDQLANALLDLGVERGDRVGIVLPQRLETVLAHIAIYKTGAVALPLAILFGGAMAGLGGAYLSIVYTPLWVENMTAGRGWIALALVVFATWRPGRAFFGAYLFGGITIIQLHIQGFGVAVPSQIMSMLPYLVTIVVLVLISRDASRLKLSAPACLGKIFHATA